MSSQTGQTRSAGKVPTADDWNRHRQLITHLYMDEEWTLTKVRKHMLETFDFRASTKMYKTRFAQWNLYKKRKRSEMAFASRILRQRDRDGKDTEFMIRNRQITRHNINVYRMRLTASEAIELDDGDAGPTPLDIVYYTPPLGSPSKIPDEEPDITSETTASTEDMLVDPEAFNSGFAGLQMQEDEFITTPTRSTDPVSSQTNMNVQPASSCQQNMIDQLNCLLNALPLERNAEDIGQIPPSVLPLRDLIAHTAGLAQVGLQSQAIELTGRALAALPPNLSKDTWLVLFELCQSVGDLAASVPQAWFRGFLFKYHEILRSETAERSGPWHVLADLSLSMVEGYDTSTSLHVQYLIHKFLMERKGILDRMSIIALFDYAFGLLREGGECIDHAKDTFEHIVRLDQGPGGLDSLLVISSMDYLFHIALRKGDDVAARQILDMTLQKAQSLPVIYWGRWHLCCMLNGCALLRHQNRREAFDTLAEETRLKARRWVRTKDPFMMEIGRSIQWM